MVRLVLRMGVGDEGGLVVGGEGGGGAPGAG